MTIERPMFPPRELSRRSYLTLAAGCAAAAVAIIPDSQAKGSPTASGASPAFAAAARDMARVRALWQDAREAVETALAALTVWEAENPVPQGRRKLKRWQRKQEALRYSPAVTAAWKAQMKAENAYREAQAAIARTPAADRGDVLAKAALAVVYDGERLSSGPAGLISIALAYDVVRLDQAVQS
ncbi:MAG: hypothetical protein WAV72_14080 [Bradyrhizobium sp.]